MNEPKALKILLVDDNPDQAIIIRKALSRAYKNYELDTAEEAWAGLQKTLSNDYSLVLCDYRLPGLSGMDFLKEVRDKGKDPDLPIIFVTSMGNERLAVEALQSGAYDYITKDDSFSERLPNVIRLALERHSNRETLKKLEKERAQSEAKLRVAYAKLRETQQELIQTEKMAALGRFSSGVAHEIKNPLGILLGGLELLNRKIKGAGLDAADVRMALEAMEDAIRRADNVVHGLLQFAKPSRMKREAVLLEGVIQEVVALLKYRASLNNVEIQTRFLNSEKLPVLIDKIQIQQVLFNVLMNAVEAMPTGGKIEIHARVTPEQCTIKIQDTGKGISPEEMSRIFEPFFTTKRDQKGTGLGLSVSKRIVENHQGTLQIESRAGAGTAITICLPLNVESERDQAVCEEKAA